MWLKSVGIVLVMMATTLTGMGFYLKEKYRLQDLKTLEQAVLQMQQQITYLALPLPDVLECVSFQIAGQIGCILQEIANKMKQHSKETAEEIWESVWLSHVKKTYFAKEDMEMILQFGKTWGGWDKQKQENNMSYFLRELEQKQDMLRKKIEKNGKMYCGMGILSGLILIVVLL